MRSTLQTRLLFLFLSGSVGVGCGASEVSSRAANDFNCPRQFITVERVGGSGYEARGCDKRATYVCADRVCVLDSEIRDARESRVPLDVLFRDYVDTYGSAIQECTGRVTALELVFDSNGSLETIASWPQETQSARTCLAHALADTRLDESPRASVTLRIDLSTATPSVVGADGPSTPPPTTTATEEPSADAPQPRDSGDDDAVRAALDAHVTDILDCAGTDRAVLRVAWESSEQPTVSLEGDLAGSPNEGCVRATLRDALPELQATSGVVVHLVSR